MALVKEIVEVYNAGDKEYTEEWMDVKYTIPPKSFIKMKRRDAVNFLGTCPGGLETIKQLEIRKDGQAIEAINLATNEPEKFISMKDGKEFKTQEELDKHLEQFKDEVVKDDRLEKETPKALKCPLCPKSFENMRGLKIHLNSHDQKDE